MIGPLRILADDLTGALDAAAPFASPERPVEVPWLVGPVLTDGPVAATSESRNVGRADAIRRALRTFDSLRVGVSEATWFKKVDSVLRGHPVAETAAIVRAGGFRRCIFAPAFPEMGRVTRGGRQVVIGPDGERPVGPADLVAAFAEEGLVARLGSAPGASDARVLIIEAETSRDLATAVRALSGLDGLLWAGSRGLAAALAGPSHPRPMPAAGAIIVGTTHPATRNQVDVIEACVTRAGLGGPIVLSPERPVLIDPVPMAADAKGTRRALSDALRRLAPPSDPRIGWIVVGGDTLSTVLEATATDGLSVLGEVEPGIPLVQAVGGRMNGQLLITKSGGFGPSDLLLSLISRTKLMDRRQVARED